MLLNYAVQVYDLDQKGDVRIDDGQLVVRATAQGYLAIVAAVKARFPNRRYWFHCQQQPG